MTGCCKKGMTFKFGPVPETDLTEAQVLEQCKMYIATLRISDDFGCDAVGIQYQQGLKDLTAASDLAEGIAEQCGSPAGQGSGRQAALSRRAAAALQ